MLDKYGWTAMPRIVIYFAPVKVRSTVITMSLCLIVVTVSSKLLCQRPRAERHQFLCTDSARCQSAPCTRTVWRSTADGLPSCRRRLAAVCCQRLVGFHHGRRPPAHRRIITPRGACRLPPWGRADGRSKTLTTNCCTASSTTLTTSCSHYCLIVILTHTPCAIVITTFRCRSNSLTDCNFITRQ